MGYEEPEGELARLRQRRRLVLILIGVVTLATILAIGGQVVWFWMNLIEFSDLYIRPIYFEILGGLVLATIALFRIDIRNRRSLTWWSVRLGLRLLREQGDVYSVPPSYFDFKGFRLTPAKFALWQVTKVLLGMLFFRNVLFGMALYSTLQGWDPGLSKVWPIFSLPFAATPMDMAYAQEAVLPALPALTLILSPIFGAFGARLLVLVGITQLARILSPTLEEVERGRALIGARVAVIEALAAIALFWIMFTSFFTAFIDFNTKFIIGALGALGVLFGFYAFIDGVRQKGLGVFSRRRIILRLSLVLAVILIAGSAMAIQSSIADARKVEWRGPYVTQQIAVNRHLAELDKVTEIPYELELKAIAPEDISAYVMENEEVLSKVRLWDREASNAKLKPQIGLRPYLDFQDTDILRFNGTIYWSASMKPILPETVLTEDVWYNEHLKYTHIPEGFLILNAHQGDVVETEGLFTQRRVYYGESGLYEEVWAAYPENREKSDELEGYFYGGDGGITLSPPLSWFLDANFFWAYRDDPIHAIRYRDVYDRLQLIFPYFPYVWQGENVDMLPVTDGENTYWLMPLIVRLDTGLVPWSGGNPFVRLVGYAVIDIYNAKITILTMGDDYFTDLFKMAYSDYVTTEVPPWLNEQFRYPRELFDWRVGMYNFFHVTDAETFIEARKFLVVPEGLASYYIIAEPPGFEDPEYVGLLSLERRGAFGRNLAGYMIVRNDYPYLGELVFYQAPEVEMPRLLGPSAVIEALERDPDFREMRTLLRDPRVGDNILYRIGDYDVYFIPVYTSITGPTGVVVELAAAVAVGATFTGDYYVSLSTAGSVEEAFQGFLIKLAGLEPTPTVNVTDVEGRRENLIQLFRDSNMTIAEPIDVSPHISFLEGGANYTSAREWVEAKELVDDFIERWSAEVDRVLVWSKDSKVNFGVLINVNGVVELHYITISLE